MCWKHSSKSEIKELKLLNKKIYIYIYIPEEKKGRDGKEK